jgi:hypothetical protein
LALFCCTQNRAETKDSFGQVLKQRASLLVVFRKFLFNYNTKGQPGIWLFVANASVFLALVFLKQRCFLQTPVFLRCGKGGGDGGVKAGGEKGRGGYGGE